MFRPRKVPAFRTKEFKTPSGNYACDDAIVICSILTANANLTNLASKMFRADKSYIER